MKRKCSMCGEVKEETNFRFLHKQNRYIAYCKKCEKLYNKDYMRIRRAREKDLKDNLRPHTKQCSKKG